MSRRSIRDWSVAAALASAAFALGACGEVGVEGMDRPDGSPPDDGDGAPPEVDGAPPGVDAAPPGECVDGITQLLKNPGFDEAMLPGGALEWTEQTPPITYPSEQIPVDPHSPNRAAWFGDVTRPEQRLRQTVTVPSGTTSLSLVLYKCFVTEEDDGEIFDQVTIALLDSSADPLETLVEYSNMDANANPIGCIFTQEILEASDSYAGEEIILEILGESDGATLTSFYFDTLSLNADGSCPDGGT